MTHWSSDLRSVTPLNRFALRRCNGSHMLAIASDPSSPRRLVLSELTDPLTVWSSWLTPEGYIVPVLFKPVGF